MDGTLYRQAPLRRAMLLRLLRAAAMNPSSGWRTFRTLKAYRQAQEHLRTGFSGDVAAAQIGMVCERTGSDRAAVAACVERWMEQEPLAVLSSCAYSGLVEFLHACRARGLKLAALSDYPAAAKLEALGIAHLFDAVLCAQDPDIGVFKPHPKGLQVTAARLGAQTSECLYVGDRVDVDAAAAQAAGIPCAILTRRAPAPPGASYTPVSGYRQLQDLLAL